MEDHSRGTDPPFEKEDGWKYDDMPEDLHVLFIEGYCQAPWMQDTFLNCKEVAGMRPFSEYSTFRVWCTDPSNLGDGDTPPDAFGVERCQEEIKSGRYHAIVVVDYSNDGKLEEFENAFGELLCSFVDAGGVVAFPSSEGLLVSTLQKLFQVSWRISNYYRTTWGPCQENQAAINYSFGNGNFARRIVQEYSAKAVSLRGVPPKERCFGVTSQSRTQSLVPHMSGENVSEKSEDGDYDIVVAMHEYGKGVIAYFGDVNAENETLWLVSAFVESRAPRLPIDNLSGIDENMFSGAMKLKEEGNGFFKTGKLDRAEQSYKAALAQFGKKLGSNGPQRDGLVSILSNLALVHLKKKEYVKAETVATNALDLEWGHGKCSYRRALARYNISLNDTPVGNLTKLREAKKDILNADIDPATRTLLKKIEREISRLEKKQQKNFSSGFAAAVAGKLK
jgi:hypothetical protein